MDCRSFVNEAVSKIQRTVNPDQRVVCAFSGGVDSSVTAKLLTMAIGERAHFVYIDHGAMREGESEKILYDWGKELPNFHVVNAADTFLKNLSNEDDPEEKRNIIGASFIEVFDGYSSLHIGADYLAQGTIKLDKIESTGPPEVFIKSHHNVGGLPEAMKLPLIEPLDELLKQQVREVGAYLELPSASVGRTPFPGPGLFIRIIGMPVTAEYLAIVRKATHIFSRMIDAEGFRERVSQDFFALFGTRSVGIKKGGGRNYTNMGAIRAVFSEDMINVAPADLPQNFTDRVCAEIMYQIPEVSRVLVDRSPKFLAGPSATVEFEWLQSFLINREDICLRGFFHNLTH